MRVRRRSFLSLEEVSEVPVLDELESTWSQAKRTALAAAWPAFRRRIGGFATGSITAIGRFGVWRRRAGVNETSMRKHLQRLRDKLRKDIEMNELTNTPETPAGLPARILELLAKPKLVDLPENPVGAVNGDAPEAMAGIFLARSSGNRQFAVRKSTGSGICVGSFLALYQ